MKKVQGMLAALVAAGVVGVSLPLSYAAAAGPVNHGPLDTLLKTHPGLRVYKEANQVSRLYGAPMSTGADPEASAWTFLQQNAAALGVDAADLAQVKTLDGLAYQPVLYDAATDSYKFFAVYFTQERNGVRVYDSNLTCLVRNEPGYPLVLIANNLKNLSGYNAQANVKTPAQIVAFANEYPATNKPEQVIFMAKAANGEDTVPTLAYVYVSQTGAAARGVSIGINGEPRQGTYDKRLVIVDAQTGVLLHQHSLIYSVADDVTGNVKGNATPTTGFLPDMANNPPVMQPLPDVTVQILGGNNANTDVLGDFVIANAGVSPVTVESKMVGPALTNGVSNQAGGGTLLLDQNVTPPGPANFLQNPAPSEYLTAQVNAMLQASIVHTRIHEINPSYPGWSRAFRANVNINDSCNAYYDGPSINFYRLSGGCNNTAYSSVLYHEYGHKLVDDAGTNQGAYGEGFGDCNGIIMTDDPITGRYFFVDGGYVRDARAGIQYPCSGEVHYCGQVLSGCIWDTRDAMVITEPDHYLDIMGNLLLGSVLLRPSGISPQITIDWLTLDDDDANIGNGTPHYNEINTGFSAHNMDAPPLQLIEFNYPNGRPTYINPDGGSTFRVEVTAQNADPEPGTGMLHYNDGSGWVSIPMNQVTDNVYDASFPAIECGTAVSYYVSAETTDNDTVNDPSDAPASTFSTISAQNLVVTLNDNFETDMGWTVQNQNLTAGAWQRGIPLGNGGRGDPTNDYDGSGKCYVTGLAGGDNDVDGGPTQLLSPTFSLSADAQFSYARWFTNDDNDADNLTVEISNDNGSTWHTVEVVHNTVGWVYKSWTVSQFVTPTSQMKLRFSASDNPNNSVTEAGVDAVLVQRVDCGGGAPYTLSLSGTCPGTVTLAWSGADAHVEQAVVYGANQGSTVIPQGHPCAGTPLGLAGSLRVINQFDTRDGSGSVNGQADTGACGHYLQLVEGGLCRTSNVAQIP